MIRRGSAVLICACVQLLLVAVVSNAYASTGFGIEHYGVSATEEGGSADTQAGSHPHEVTIEAVLDPNGHTPAEEVKDLNFKLPPGMIVDPRAVPVGSAVGMAQMGFAGKQMSATVYNVTPAPGELGRFGFTIEGVPMSIGIALHTGGDETDAGDDGMMMNINAIPDREVESLKLTLGEASPQLFTLPTSCSGSLQTTVQGESWGKETTSLSAAFSQMTDCNRLSFAPALDVTPNALQADEPSGYTLRLNIPQNESPSELATSQLGNASITLPVGTSLSLSATNGLAGCTETQFVSPTGVSPICPDSSKVGRIEIDTPLLAHPLEGSVFLASSTANPLGTLVTLYVVAEEPVSDMRIELTGQMSLDASTGQPTLTFNELPRLPISEVKLYLFGGERSLLANPPTCGPATSTAVLVPWSGGPEAVAHASFEVTEGTDGGACGVPAPFDPGLRLEPTTVPAGGNSTFTLTVTGDSGEQDFSRFSIRLPAGLTWMLGSVLLCGEPQAAQGGCPVASEIGQAIVSVGPIPRLAWFTGGVYLTEGYAGGQFGLSIAFEAVTGPFDLGELVLRAAIAQDPTTGALTITSDPLPQIVDGIPLRTHALEMVIERSGFILDPTVCESRQVGATVESAEGANTQMSDPFNVEGCSPPTGGTGGAKPAMSSSHTSKHEISHMSERLDGDHLLLRFTTSVAGAVTISGRGVHGYTKKLRPGVHRVKLTLSRLGVFDFRHHRRFVLRLTLRVAGGEVSTAETTIEPARGVGPPREAPHHN